MPSGEAKHEHYWSYPHVILQGRRDEEIAVVRYCANCPRREVAFTSKWRKAVGDYARDEHYKLDL